MIIEQLLSNKGNLVEGPLLVKPKVFSDSRGFFYESWNQISFSKSLGEDIIFSQDNHSCSITGVLRGLHYQVNPKPQGKLVRCTKGSIFDVAVDIRKNSSTFKEWVNITLNEKNKMLFWIPVGFAHGFLSLEDNSEVLYKASGNWSKQHDRSIRWDDPSIGIEWPLKSIDYLKPLLSEKDSNAPYLENAEIFE